MEFKNPQCPFYGFSVLWRVQDKSKNPNNCALKMDLCGKIEQGKNPDWERCCANTKEFNEDLKELLNRVRVYSTELFDKGGVSLEYWIDYVMKPIKQV